MIALVRINIVVMVPRLLFSFFLSHNVQKTATEKLGRSLEMRLVIVSLISRLSSPTQVFVFIHCVTKKLRRSLT